MTRLSSVLIWGISVPNKYNREDRRHVSQLLGNKDAGQTLRCQL